MRMKEESLSFAACWRHLDGQRITDFCTTGRWGQIAVQACKAENAGAHRVTRLNETNSCEIKCVAFSRMIYQDAHWNMKRSYRLDGKLFPEQNLVSFPILDAIPIENGKILEAAVSPTVAPRQAEASPSQKQSQFGSKSQQRGCLRGVWARQAKSRGLSCQLG